MSTGAGIGLIVILGAVLFGLWAVVRAVIGPARKLALMHAGYSVLLLLAGAIAVGTGIPPRSTTKSTATVSIAVSEPAMAIDEGESDPPVTSTLKGPAREATAITEENTPVAPVEVAKVEEVDVPKLGPTPVVDARYQTSHTLVSLVLKNFSPETSDALREIARHECGGSDFCSIGFWTDDAKAPRTLRMSDEAVAARLAHYVHSKATGIDTLKWNCEVVPAESGDCL